jgi:DNA processing protein
VVVVEAELRSGSLITARLAAEQGREVFAVPGSPLEPRSRGTNDLLRQGATLCEGVDDVVRALQLSLIAREPDRRWAADEPAGSPDAEIAEAAERVGALLSPTPASVDELARLSGFAPPVVFAALVELSLVGRAALLPGGRPPAANPPAATAGCARRPRLPAAV